MTTSSRKLNFSQGSDFFYRQSQEFSDKSDYLKALRFIDSALEISNDFEYHMLKARILSEMDLYRLSNNHYFRALRQRESAKCYQHLAANYANLKEETAAQFNLLKYKEIAGKEGIDVFAFDGVWEMFEALFDDEGLDLDELLDGADDEGIYFFGDESPFLAEKNSERDEALMGFAEALTSSGDYDCALELLRHVPEKSPHYQDALNFMGAIYCFDEDYDGARRCVEKALKRFPNDSYAASTAVIANALTGKKQKCKQYKEHLSSLKLEDEYAIYRAITAMCVANDHELALRYCREYLELQPYNLDVLLTAALAAYNCNLPEQSLDYLSTIMAIDGGGLVARHYKRRIAKEQALGRPAKKLAYVRQVPEREFEVLLRRLNSILQSTRPTIDKRIHDPDVMRLIEWGLSLGNMELTRKIVCTLSVYKDFRPLCLDILCRDTVESLTKRALVFALCFSFVENLDIVIEGEFKRIRFLRPDALDSCTSKMFLAYVNVCTALCIFDVGFEKRLFRAAEEMIERVNSCGGDDEARNAFRSSEALSAVLGMRAGLLDRNLSKVCELFGASKSTYRKYYKRIFEGADND